MKKLRTIKVNTAKLEELIDRYLAFDFDSQDKGELISKVDGNWSLNLDVYIKALDIKYKEDTIIEIEFPDVIKNVFINSLSDVYENKQAYRFIFPENLIYFGYMCPLIGYGVALNKLYNGMGGYQNINFCNSEFDFRKCKKITKILLYGFSHCDIHAVYFGSGIELIGENAFKESSIDILKFESVEHISDNAFQSASIKELSLPDTIISVGHSSLRFMKAGIESLCLKDTIGMSSYLISNISKVYIPYGYILMRELRKDLEKLQRLIKDGVLTAQEALAMLKDMSVDIGNTAICGREYMNDVEENIYKYKLQKLDNLMHILDTLVVSDTDVSLYFYNIEKDKNTDTVKDRDYTFYGSRCINAKTKADLNVYIEL